MKPYSRGHQAFTLLELLVVISIIVLLVSILLPTLSRARDLAQRVQCLSNHRQIGVATFAYGNDYGGALPDALCKLESAGGGFINGASNNTNVYYSVGDSYHLTKASGGGSLVSDRKTFGVGALWLEGYLGELMRDPSAFSNRSDHVANLTQETLTQRMETIKSGGVTQTIVGSYIMPTVAFMEADGYVDAGDRGVVIGGWDEDNGAPYEATEAAVLAQCMTGSLAPDGAYNDEGTHAKDGVNSLYVDGSANYVALENDLLSFWQSTIGTGGLTEGNRDTRFWRPSNPGGHMSIPYASSLFD